MYSKAKIRILKKRIQGLKIDRDNVTVRFYNRGINKALKIIEKVFPDV